LRRWIVSIAEVRPSSSRNTAHFSFIISPSSSLISEIRRPPFARPTISSIIFCSAARPAAEGVGIVMPAARSAACSPERRPKISVSSSELAPRRLPPWTETHATSPAAYRPGIEVAPHTSVLTPPMM
jgi:hypothetical protein